MRDTYFYEVMFDDTSIDVSKEVGLPLLMCRKKKNLWAILSRTKLPVAESSPMSP
mgnify:CR=1 FL=1